MFNGAFEPSTLDCFWMKASSCLFVDDRSISMHVSCRWTSGNDSKSLISSSAGDKLPWCLNWVLLFRRWSPWIFDFEPFFRGLYTKKYQRAMPVPNMTKANTETIMVIKYELSSALSRFVVAGSIESIWNVDWAPGWSFHDVVVVERTCLVFSLSFVELSPGAVESISAVRRALEWPFHDLVVVERTRVNFSVSFVELGSVYAKHPPSYMGKPLFRPTALITAMFVACLCFTWCCKYFSFIYFVLISMMYGLSCASRHSTACVVDSSPFHVIIWLSYLVQWSQFQLCDVHWNGLSMTLLL